MAAKKSKPSHAAARSKHKPSARLSASRMPPSFHIPSNQPLAMFESASDTPVYYTPEPEAPPPRPGSRRLVLLLTLLVPGFGHWMMRSRHAPSYLMLALLIWFITLSALLAFAFQGFAWLFLLLPLAYHLAALHDAKAEWDEQEFRRWLHILF